jgi:hypothetical protein
MADLAAELQNHLRTVLGIDVSLRPWDDAARLPAFLRERYRFRFSAVRSRRVVFILDESAEEQAPAVLRKHLDRIQRVGDAPVVYVRTAMSMYSRQRLIGQGMPFVVPGQQLYLPDLGIDLRERFPSPSPRREQFRPATQAVLLWALQQGRENEGRTRGRTRGPTGGVTGGVTGGRTVARTLGYAPMTLSRAMDEIEAAGLAQSVASGRERAMRWTAPPQEVWERAQDRLTDPVRSRHLVRTAPGAASGLSPGLSAGLSALATLTLLAEPSEPVYATNAAAWTAFRTRATVETAPFREPGVIEVEVWSYDPALLGAGERVDPLSLYLSLRDEPDERVGQALRSMMEDVAW